MEPVENEAKEGNDMETIIFTLITHSGDARSSAMEAISFAKKGEFDQAEESLRNATEKLGEAHKAQTQLIQGEAQGNKTEFSLLLIHAQDHLMNAMTVKDLATEIVELYKR